MTPRLIPKREMRRPNRKAKGYCTRCGKRGLHRAPECTAKYDQNGHPIGDQRNDSSNNLNVFGPPKDPNSPRTVTLRNNAEKEGDNGIIRVTVTDNPLPALETSDHDMENGGNSSPRIKPECRSTNQRGSGSGRESGELSDEIRVKKERRSDRKRSRHRHSS